MYPGQRLCRRASGVRTAEEANSKACGRKFNLHLTDEPGHGSVGANLTLTEDHGSHSPCYRFGMRLPPIEVLRFRVLPIQIGPDLQSADHDFDFVFFPRII